MQPEQMILPAIATVALGTALLVPLRDNRPGKRATYRGKRVPIRSSAPVSSEPVQSAIRVDAKSPEGRPVTTNPSGVPWRAAGFGKLGFHLRRFFEARDAEAERHECGEEETHIVNERSFAEHLDELFPAVTLVASEPTDAETPSLSPSENMGGEDGRWPVIRPVLDRIVPLTRMPLRSKPAQISWTLSIPNAEAIASRSGRHALLAHAAEYCKPEFEATLVAAYREEDADGRLLALRAIHKHRFDVTQELLTHALHVGTEDERSFAVDALLGMQRPEAVTPALSDRVDAIAAQAALGFVASRNRADYFSALEPFVDHNRIRSILALLAGIVE